MSDIHTDAEKLVAEVRRLHRLAVWTAADEADHRAREECAGVAARYAKNPVSMPQAAEDYETGAVDNALAIEGAIRATTQKKPPLADPTGNEGNDGEDVCRTEPNASEEAPAPNIGPAVLDGESRSWEAMLNVRDFVKKLLLANPSVKCTGAGVGPRSADLDIEIEGWPFNITIVPRIKR